MNHLSTRLAMMLMPLLIAGCMAPSQRPRVIRPPVKAGPATSQHVPAVTVPPPQMPPVPVVPVVTNAPSVPAPVDRVPRRTVIAVQACLDRVNFSGGRTDGHLTPEFESALKAWQGARGLPMSGAIDRFTLARCGNLDLEFESYTVTAEDHRLLSPFPRTWLERSRLEHHGYETILEAVAERAHASEEVIRELNPGAVWPDPPAGTVVTIPKSKPAKHLDLARVVISLSRRELQGFDAAGTLVLQFPCSIAKDVSKRPVGELKVVNAADKPFYTFDPSVFPEDPEAQTIGRNLVIKPGPNNPVGTAWIGLDRTGYGIHGTPWPEEIGKTESHGCFRLANWNATKLIRMVRAGTPVVVEP